MLKYGSRAFGHAGPATWYTLPNILKCSSHCLPTFRRHQKKFFTSRSTGTPSACKIVTVNTSYKVLTY